MNNWRMRDIPPTVVTGIHFKPSSNFKEIADSMPKIDLSSFNAILRETDPDLFIKLVDVMYRHLALCMDEMREVIEKDIDQDTSLDVLIKVLKDDFNVDADRTDVVRLTIQVLKSHTWCE